MLYLGDDVDVPITCPTNNPIKKDRTKFFFFCFFFLFFVFFFFLQSKEDTEFINITKDLDQPNYGVMAFRLPILQQHKKNQEHIWGQLTDYKQVHFDKKISISTIKDLSCQAGFLNLCKSWTRFLLLVKSRIL